MTPDVGTGGKPIKMILERPCIDIMEYLQIIIKNQYIDMIETLGSRLLQLYTN